MSQILIFILGIFIGGALVWIFKGKAKTGRASDLKNVEQKQTKTLSFIEKQRQKKQENKKRILAEFERVERLTNDDVQKLLNISDATATRYLEDLEKQGKIKQVGRTGRHVYYERI